MSKTSATTKDSIIPSIPAGRLVGHDGPVHAVRFTADGKYCLTAGQDRTVRLWNPTKIDPAYNNNTTTSSIPHALPIQTYKDGHTHPVNAIAIDNTSTTILSASDRALIITDALTARVKYKIHGSHAGRINTVATSNGSECFLSGSYDGTVKIWDGRSRNRDPIQVLDDATDSITAVLSLQRGGGGINTNTNEAEIITTSVDGFVRTYDLRMGKLYTDDTGNSPITGANLDYNKECIVTSCLNGRIKLFEKSTGNLLQTYQGGHVAGKYGLECCILSNDLCVVSGSEDGSVVLYDLVSGNVLQRLDSREEDGGEIQQQQQQQQQRRLTCSVACYPKKGKWESMVLSASYSGEALVWCTNENDYAQWGT